MNSIAFQFYGWFAYLSATATILTLVTGILFFTVGKLFGKINDVSSIFQLLFMVPLAIMFVQILPACIFPLSVIAAIIGIVGLLISAFGQSLLVLGRIDFQGSLKYFPAVGAIGVWLVLVCLLGIGSGQLPGLLAWTGMLAGIGYWVTVIGFLKGGQQNIFFYIGALVTGISYPVWAIWLGRLLFTGSLGMSAG